MTIFGLDESAVTPLISAISPSELSAAEITERFARASWTGICEPGDRVAGLLVQALGASQALTAVIDRWPVTSSEPFRR